MRTSKVVILKSPPHGRYKPTDKRSPADRVLGVTKSRVRQRVGIKRKGSGCEIAIHSSDHDITQNRIGNSRRKITAKRGKKTDMKRDTASVRAYKKMLVGFHCTTSWTELTI